MSKIGDAIRKERKAREMVLADVAEVAGISIAYLSDVERGNRIPRPEMVLSIANAFPDIDSTEWLWLLLADDWDEAVAGVMRRYASVQAVVPVAPAVMLKMDSRGGMA